MLFSIVSYALRSDFRAEVVKKKKKSDQDARCLTFHKTKEEKKNSKHFPTPALLWQPKLPANLLPYIQKNVKL